MTLLRRIQDALRSALMKRAGLLRALALVASVVALTAAVPNPAEACGISDPLSCVAMIFVKIFQLLTALMGWILVLEVEALIRVAQYFNFVSPGPAAVQLGWVVTRDLANMFFIVVLLIIAFGTILGSSTYHYSKNLPRLLIMAVVINFSKTICGIFIDMGQVVMLTFVNGFKETAAGNFMNAYQINKLLALGNTEGSYTFGMVIAMMFAFILAAIAVCVTLVLLVIILFRVVMLWVLIILSPLAFLASAIPRGGDYYAEWWGEFKKYIITGPIIAFFMWLALASVQKAGPGGFSKEGGFAPPYAGTGEAAAASGKGDNKIPTEAGTADTIMNMVIAICIMFAGLQQASKSKAVGSGFASSMRSGLQKTGRAIATGGLKMAAQPLMTGGGKMLARVPLVGGLGRAAVLKGESWKKERQAGREKFAGTPEDLARLSPGAFKRQMDNLAGKDHKLDAIDKKRLGTMMDIASKDPKLAKSLTDTGQGSHVLDTLIRNSSGKDLQDNIGRMMTDKNAQGWAKSDPDLLGNAYDKAQLEAYEHDGKGNFTLDDAGKQIVKDPNMLKTIGDLEQKFASQLFKSGKLDPAKLKDIVPKMSSDDLDGLAAGDMAAFMPHMKSEQLRSLAKVGTGEQQDGMLKAVAGLDAGARKEMIGKFGAGDIPASWFGNAEIADKVLDGTRSDPKARAEAIEKDKGGSLRNRADARLAEALSSGDKDKFVSAMPDAISVGSLTASSISSDAKLQAAIKENANRFDMNAMGRNVSVSDAGRTDATKAMAALIGEVNPEKIRNARKSGMADHVLPSAADMEAKTTGAKNATRDTYVNEAMSGALATAIAGQVSQLRGVGADDQADALNKRFEGIKPSMEQLQQAQSTLAAAEAKLANSAGMNASQLDALKSAAEGLKKNVDTLKTSVAQAAAEIKGQKFDTGASKNRGNRRT